MASPETGGTTTEQGPVSPPAATSSSPRAPEAGASVPGHLPLEADDEFPENDADSFYGSDNGSATTSLSASVNQYRIENGRTYHSYGRSGSYYMPNDDVENDRLDLQHHLMTIMYDDQLYVCPAGKDKPLSSVLDAGCGTGIWAIDVADANPQAMVVGVDLSPIQPRDVPTNLEFIVDDLEEEWAPNKDFDFINMRYLIGSIKDWPKLISQAFQHLTPGGYLEVSDPMQPITSDDGTLTEDSPLYQWNLKLLEASKKAGRPMDTAAGMKQRLIDAGFVNVVENRFVLPSNSWPRDRKHKNVGSWNCENMYEAVTSISLMLFTNFLGWSAAEVEVFLVGVRKDLRNTRIHAYWTIYTVYGQKPE